MQRAVKAFFDLKMFHKRSCKFREYTKTETEISYELKKSPHIQIQSAHERIPESYSINYISMPFLKLLKLPFQQQNIRLPQPVH